ncbi:hypothetical protein F5B19DRAFT_486141 [Rostrohypoxylon terebratum]|nr:hypothetical protein F5B19DRAFT_486141 [Rostrohypoxylon terebratum]
MIGLLGPDFLFGIALDQLSSAHRSVKLFEQDKYLRKGTKWTCRYAFFVDMGVIFLTSPDFPDGFPITGKQFHYLVNYGHVDFPDMGDMAIDERNTADTLWQVFWFSVAELQRAKDGLPMTTLELMALSFVFLMIATSICRFQKPSITYPRMTPTKNGKSMNEIRATANALTHLDLSATWYCTPIDFIGGHRWGIEAYWSYYTRLSHAFHLKIVSRAITSHPWDRFPSDMWLPPEPIFVPFGALVLVFFSSSLLLAWNFFSSTHTEQLLCVPLEAWVPREIEPELQLPQSVEGDVGLLVKSWRNISVDQDPEMAVPLRVIVPMTITSYDFLSLRIQPAGIYVTVNRFIPFLGGG